jgi:hypothetical protein
MQTARVKGTTKGDEGQAGRLPVDPGHRASQHEGGGLEALLSGAVHVCRRGRVGEFFVVFAPPTHDRVLFVGREARDALQVMLPLLHRHEARAFEPRPRRRQQRGSSGSLCLGVLGPVFVAR